MFCLKVPLLALLLDGLYGGGTILFEGALVGSVTRWPLRGRKKSAVSALHPRELWLLGDFRGVI